MYKISRGCSNSSIQATILNESDIYLALGEPGVSSKTAVARFSIPVELHLLIFSQHTNCPGSFLVLVTL